MGSIPTGLPDYVVAATSIKPPTTPTDIPREHLEKYYRDTYNALTAFGVPQFSAGLVAGLIVAPCIAAIVAKDVVLILMKVLLPSWGAQVLQSLDDLRKGIDPSVGQLAVGVLNELLGSDVNTSHMPMGIGQGDHLTRAKQLGAILHSQLEKEFLAGGQVTPDSGAAAAQTFSGLMINFGTANGILATFGGLVPWIHLDEIREIGEGVAKNLGLSRLGRQALRPLVQACVELPYRWKVFKTARPTLLTVQECVNLFSGGSIDRDTMFDILGRQGYADNLIEQIIALHQKKLAEHDAWTLYRLGNFSEDQFNSALEKLGWTQDGAQQQKQALLLRAGQTMNDTLIASAATAYEHGHIQRGELEGLVKATYPLAADQQAIMLGADYRVRAASKHLTLSELQDMLDRQILSLDDFNAYLVKLGYSAADVQLLQIWTLDKNAEKDAKAAAAARKAAAKTTGATGTAGA